MDTKIIHSYTKTTQQKYFVSRQLYLWTQPNAKNTRFIFAEDLKVFKDRICCQAQYIPQFALYPYTEEAKRGKVVNLLEVIEIMKSAELKRKGELIVEARKVGDKKTWEAIKKSLPYITHSGIFLPRQNAGLVQPGFTFQLDIDKINNAQEILEKVIYDKNLTVLIATLSVSGNGVKALLFLKELVFIRETWNAEQYRSVYHSATDILETYFKEKYGVQIDKQMKSISQPFFLFYAPHLFINKNLSQWI